MDLGQKLKQLQAELEETKAQLYRLDGAILIIKQLIQEQKNDVEVHS
jgi:hypothetical protein